MLARTKTVAFQGVDTLPIDVQVQMSSGLPNFTIVGLADKAVAESRERIRAALNAVGLALPPKRITVNLSPADVQKEGSHYDLPIAIGLLAAMDIIPKEQAERYVSIGELALDGNLSAVQGTIVAAINAHAMNCGIICPHQSGPEAAWAGKLEILAPTGILSLINHFKGHQLLTQPKPMVQQVNDNKLDLADVKGQALAKRALEIAAAGGHNLLFSGPPGSGKSMLAQRLTSILPPLQPKEALEVTMVHSIAGLLDDGYLRTQRPYRDPHHSASLPALVGGGAKAKPGEITLAHNGVLFLDELPEFSRQALESLRQPLESGKITVSRANAHVTYPARFQLIAAMNPCKCGHLGSGRNECRQAPMCGSTYQQKLSGPILDRFDLHVDVPHQDIFASHKKHFEPDTSAQVAQRVKKAHQRQFHRIKSLFPGVEKSHYLNAHLTPSELEKIAPLDKESEQLLKEAHTKFGFSGRAYHRILKVARTIADLDASEKMLASHISEALMYRQMRYA